MSYCCHYKRCVPCRAHPQHELHSCVQGLDRELEILESQEHRDQSQLDRNGERVCVCVYRRERLLCVLVCRRVCGVCVPLWVCRCLCVRVCEDG